jgi:protein tyrosine/serine phosphatase
VEKYGIRTIINLRGEQPSEDWYRGEVTEARRLGIEHIDFKMSAHHVLSQEDSERLIAIMMDAPKPILVHCKAGADRTGLASALYLAAVAKAGEEPAEAQISLRYGHISLSVSPSYAMDETFEELEPWLGFPWS